MWTTVRREWTIDRCMSDSRIYLDHAATSPLRPAVRQAMDAALHLGNPSSAHTEGRAARAALEDARRRIGLATGAQDAHVILTSGGTEANATAILGCVLRARETRGASFRPHVIASATEHAAVLESLELARAIGADIEIVPVDPSGVLRPETIDDYLREETVLVCLMAVNNETGVVQDIRGLREHLPETVALHTDAVQLTGRRFVDMEMLGAEFVALSAHKIGGPRGCGALLVRPGCPWSPLVRGGGQEDGRRGGTENVAAAVGFAVALEIAQNELEQVAKRHEALARHWRRGVAAFAPRAVLHGRDAERVAGIVSLSFERVTGSALAGELDAAGVSVSTGSACHSARSEPSHVLTAMGCQPTVARGALRVSFGPSTDAHELELALHALESALRRLELLSPK